MSPDPLSSGLSCGASPSPLSLTSISDIDQLLSVVRPYPLMPRSRRCFDPRRSRRQRRAGRRVGRDHCEDAPFGVGGGRHGHLQQRARSQWHAPIPSLWSLSARSSPLGLVALLLSWLRDACTFRTGLESRGLWATLVVVERRRSKNLMRKRGRPQRAFKGS